MEKINIDDGIIIEAKMLITTEKAYLLNCEGDERWFSKSLVNFDQTKNELELPRWLAKKVFPNEGH